MAWGSDHVLRQELQWPLPTPICEWLVARAFTFTDCGKPARPKEALDALRTVHRLPRSAALYEKIAERASEKCTDPAFLRLRAQLVEWFGGGAE